MTTCIIGVDHPAVAAENVDALADWYCDVLGYEKVFRHDKPVWILRAADGTMLEIMPRDKTERPQRTTWTPGWSHVAMRTGDLQAAMQYLESKGVKWTGDVFTAVGGGRGRNFCDLDGNMLQVIERVANA
ncbi:MAG: VOC family protein [Thermoguttaceae bacterium]